MKRAATITLALALLAAAWCTAATAAPRKFALLVGVGAYKDVRPLEGPVSDVTAMRAVLVERWGFKPADVQTLLDQAATKQAILKGIADIKQRSQPGDEVLIFFSGHGTSALDTRMAQLALPQSTGAFVPFDFNPNAKDVASTLLVGRTDLVPALSSLEQGGRHVWVVSDSCYSGNQVRAVRPASDPRALPSRFLPLPSADKIGDLNAEPARTSAPPPPYPYQSTVYLSAASEGEQAKDIPTENLPYFPTIDGKPHGALTDALLRVLGGQLPADTNGDGLLSLNEIQGSVVDFMAGRGYGQMPTKLPAVDEDAQALGARAVLGAPTKALPAGRAATPPLRIRQTGLPADLLKEATAWQGIELVSAAPFDLAVKSKGAETHLVTPSCDLIGSAPKNDTGALRALLQQQAWVRKIKALAEQSSRASLAAEITPNSFGGSFKLKEKLQITARPDKPATFVVLDADSSGQVVVLYPGRSASEARPRAANELFSTGNMEVLLPLGTDVQFTFAFDNPPKGLADLPSGPVPTTDARLALLDRMIKDAAGRMTYKQTEFRTLPDNPAELVAAASICP